MKMKLYNRTAAFTLVEIMIVVAVIGLLAALAVPGFVKARKQSQGRRTVNDARLLDNAIDEWALNTGQQDGNSIDTSATGAGSYLKCAWINTDVLGNPILIGGSGGGGSHFIIGGSGGGNGPGVSGGVGENQVTISSATKSALAGVGIDWGPY
jgi:prepilin-type N-terminal cleavage/methylation domain-containing protein